MNAPLNKCAVIMKRFESKFWYHLLAIAIVFVWGTTYISTSILLNGGVEPTGNGLSPIQIYMLRCVIAYVGLLTVCHKRFKSDNWKDELWFLMLGLAGGTVYYVCENSAVEYTQAANVSLIVSLAPLMTIFIMTVFYKAKIHPTTLAGVLIALVGIAAVVFGTGEKWGTGAMAFIGDILAALSALLWAIYSTMLRRVLPCYSTLFITRKVFFYGLCSAILVAAVSGEHLFPIETLSKPIVFGNLLYLGLTASLACFFLFNVVVNKIGVVTTNNYNYLNPVITFVFAILVLGEPFSWVSVIGIVITLLGLWVAQMRNNLEV